MDKKRLNLDKEDYVFIRKPKDVFQVQMVNSADPYSTNKLIFKSHKQPKTFKFDAKFIKLN